MTIILLVVSNKLINLHISLVSVNLVLNNGTILHVWKIWVSKPVKQPEGPSDRQPTSLLQNISFYLKLLEHSFLFVCF